METNDAKIVYEMHAIIRGDVQGVGFRATTLKYARQIGLSGTVKNLSNGNVEIQAQGSKPQLEKLLDLLKQSFGDGIQDISFTFVTFKGILKNFQIL